MVSWLSKKQDSVSLSTVEAKYIVAASYYTQVLWMKQTLKDIGVICDEPIPIFYDNTSTINISKNLVMHSIKKHISIKYHFSGEKVLENEVILEYVTIKEQIKDIFTKALLKDTFEHLRERLGVIGLSKLSAHEGASV